MPAWSCRIHRTPWAKALRLVALLGGLLIAGFGPSVSSALAASTPMVDLGTASTYAVLSGASVGNTVSAPGMPFTTLRGDLGVAADTQPTGFPPGVVTGATRVGSPAAAAYNDLGAAYSEVQNRTGGTLISGDLAGVILTPGLYSAAAAISNTGTVTLDAGGHSNAVFVIQVGGALTMAAGASVKLINGASASRVFWQVDGGAGIGANVKFVGTLMAHDAAAIGAGTQVNGRALALTGAISLDSNDFYSSPPVVTIDGGAAAITSSTTPTISGTTDVAPPAIVTVTIAGQALTASPSDGAWSVTSAILANNTYAVVASVTDGAGNPGSATQQLTIDTIPPVVTIDGGASQLTNDATPTIAGTSDAVGAAIRVSVDSQNLTAFVQLAGTWNVTPTTLTDGTRTITASVTDPAGNQSTASQVLTVDTTPPAVTIDGGANVLTNNATPDISGTAAVPAGTTVTVTLADQTLTGPVQGDGTWTVTAAALSNGPHRVVVSVSDPAGNLASITQTLTVDTVSPFIAITGGSAAASDQANPTIAGTTDAGPGTTVTVSIAGQVMTTLVQVNGSWNTTATSVADGTWQVIATVSDPAGDTGSAIQALTIASSVPGVTGPPGPTGPPGGTGSAGPPGDTGQTGAAGQTVTSTTLAVWLSAARFSFGRGHRVAVRFVLSGAADVTLIVMHGKRVVARLKTAPRKAGRGRISWNGSITRKPAPRGTYEIIVRVVSASGTSASDSATLRIT